MPEHPTGVRERSEWTVEQWETHVESERQESYTAGWRAGFKSGKTTAQTEAMCRGR